LLTRDKKKPLTSSGLVASCDMQRFGHLLSEPQLPVPHAADNAPVNRSLVTLVVQRAVNNGRYQLLWGTFLLLLAFYVLLSTYGCPLGQ